MIPILPLLAFFAVAAPADGPPTPVVVELFTSQGCSSCPPADAVLAELDAGLAGDGVVIVPLGLHVDYWDDLGWPDPLGQAAFSQRQRAYAATLDDRVYTPQMVVDGRVGFVGSRRAEAVAAVQAAADKPTIGIEARREGDAVSGTLELPDVTGTVHVALLTDATIDVDRGENRGRKLSHVASVLELRTLDVGVTSFSFMAADGDDLRVAAFTQSPDLGPITAAGVTTVAE